MTNTPSLTPKRTPFNWAEWLIYGALALWVLVLIPLSIWGWPTLFRWAKHPATSAWIQTAGVLLGIGVAIWVPWRQRERELRDARRAAFSIAVYLVAIMRIARKRRAGMSAHASETVLMHLGVATKMWAQVRMEMMPHSAIPSFMALISITEEAIGWAGREESDPVRMALLAAVWDDLSRRTEGFVAAINPTWRPSPNRESALGERDSPTDDLRAL